ncbi:hypothetical protein GGTG_01466 [Gaeumannomyces tritici R3-111a-1]|uniref:protein-histidine N-methyltransferase n=1 Tax=Gaeumannomyces tritici (strain R3-111a-1) TaxID=644352 RepID=J3NJN6_GAET3|nr:hypothetical protein GGTG_01466 [Gaeumannomyces tritici R3-111a-1]EJT81488.1 hypothetical protein GGTG_01466 [Gaeumannomyces tritici R3-111a-1]
MAFSFSFAGDDIEDDGTQQQQQPESNVVAGGGQDQGPRGGSSTSAFPVQGRAQLAAERHDLGRMLAQLPSRIAYGTLEVEAQGGGVTRLPRRELWDVRVQLAAEDEGLTGGGGGGHDEAGLGQHDVRTGIYEGGFKSWESSVDLVKVLARHDMSPALALAKGPVRMIELGCGTALPSLAVFQWAAALEEAARSPLSLTLADYNPSVLQLVTLPNFILAWALLRRGESELLQEALSSEENLDGGGELELDDEVKAAFLSFLETSNISLSFVSGGWSPAFVELLYDGLGAPLQQQQQQGGNSSSTLVVGAETIYSPFALGAFADTLLAVLRRERSGGGGSATSIVAAKRLYFGVGGSLDDFVDRVAGEGVDVRWLAEETEGVRRGVVQCSLP